MADGELRSSWIFDDHIPPLPSEAVKKSGEPGGQGYLQSFTNAVT